MWQELLLELALLMFHEGLLPFLNPAGFKQAIQMISQMDDKQLRISGLVMMIAGVLLMYLVKN
ncbi:MAG: DUF2065 domain-containing protein [Gammaproteobacteria bacterium]